MRNCFPVDAGRLANCEGASLSDAGAHVDRVPSAVRAAQAQTVTIPIVFHMGEA
jgi:hypothetical protein